MSDLLQNRLFGKTAALLTRSLGYRSANHSVISGNIANIDTPGYTPKQLTFDEALQAAAEGNEGTLRKTNPKHFSHYGEGCRDKVSFRLREKVPAMGDSNQLNIDREMADMVKNNLLYEAAARMLSRKLEALRTAIEEGKR